MCRHSSNSAAKNECVILTLSLNVTIIITVTVTLKPQFEKYLQTCGDGHFVPISDYWSPQRYVNMYIHMHARAHTHTVMMLQLIFRELNYI